MADKQTDADKAAAMKEYRAQHDSAVDRIAALRAARLERDAKLAASKPAVSKTAMSKTTASKTKEAGAAKKAAPRAVKAKAR